VDSAACTANFFAILLFPRLVSLEFFPAISFVGSRCYQFYLFFVTQHQSVSSSLELASKNILCGSVKMVYALIYTLFLGFGLQIGSDLYLLFDANTRHHLASLDAVMSRTLVYTGNFIVDNGTLTRPEIPSFGSFTFTNGSAPLSMNMHDGCFRALENPWYLQPFPFWTQFITVPLFSTLSSLSNLQPWRELDLVVMVVISCISFAANKAANHFIFNRSDIVSAIGAFAVGLLGNIYSRMFGGTAFTVMVTGVLFLVPVRVSCPCDYVPRGDVCRPWLTLFFPFAVGSLAGCRWSDRRIWQRDRHRECYDCGYDRYHRWTFHESGARVHVRHKKERGHVLVLNCSRPSCARTLRR